MFNSKCPSDYFLDADFLVAAYLGDDFFVEDLFADDFFVADFFMGDLLVADFFVADFLVADFLVADFLVAAFLVPFLGAAFLAEDFLGTFAPSSLASDKPIAIACLRLVTFLPLRPLRSLPDFISSIALFTLSWLFFEYFAIMNWFLEKYAIYLPAG